MSKRIPDAAQADAAGPTADIPAASEAPTPASVQAPSQTQAIAEPAAIQIPWLHDQYAGQGGDYIVDPDTGQRRPA